MRPFRLPGTVALSPREQAWVGLILGIFLIGLTARQIHGCRGAEPVEVPDPNNPVAIQP